MFLLVALLLAAAMTVAAATITNRRRRRSGGWPIAQHPNHFVVDDAAVAARTLSARASVV